MLWTLPMAHHFAVTIVLYLYYGVTTVLETSNRPDLLFKAARKSGTHLLYGSPFHFAQLAQCKEAGPLPELREQPAGEQRARGAVHEDAVLQDAFGEPVGEGLYVADFDAVDLPQAIRPVEIERHIRAEILPDLADVIVQSDTDIEDRDEDRPAHGQREQRQRQTTLPAEGISQ